MRIGQGLCEPAWHSGWMVPDFATSMNSYTQGLAVLHSVSSRKILKPFFSITAASRAKLRSGHYSQWTASPGIFASGLRPWW